MSKPLKYIKDIFLEGPRQKCIYSNTSALGWRKGLDLVKWNNLIIVFREKYVRMLNSSTISVNTNWEV